MEKKPWEASPMLEDVGTTPAAVKSAARAFRIIEFFDEIRRSARAGEIADRLGYPQSSTSMLLNSLVRLGYLDFDPASKTYLPSIRTAVLATWRDNGCFRDGTMLTAMERLAKATGLAACLTVRTGIFTRYLHVVQHVQPGIVHVTLTARRFAIQCAAGIMLIKHLSTGEIRALVHRTRAEHAQAPALDTVLDRVQAARRDGCFVSDGLVTPENGAVARDLPQDVTGGWQEMALSVAGDRRNVVGRVSLLAKLLEEAIDDLQAHRSHT